MDERGRAGREVRELSARRVDAADRADGETPGACFDPAAAGGGRHGEDLPAGGRGPFFHGAAGRVRGSRAGAHGPRPRRARPRRSRHIGRHLVKM